MTARDQRRAARSVITDAIRELKNVQAGSHLEHSTGPRPSGCPACRTNVQIARAVRGLYETRRGIDR